MKQHPSSLLIMITLIFTSFSLINNESLLHSTLSILNGNKSIIYLSFNNINLPFIINLTSQSTIINNSKFIALGQRYFKPIPSSTITIKTSSSLPNDECTLTLYTGHLSLTTPLLTGGFVLTPFNYNFYSPLDLNTTSIHNSLSLTYKYTSLEHSIVHQLCKTNAIRAKQFGFEAQINKNDNTFFFGNPPPYLIHNKYPIVLHVDKTKSNWGFTVHSITFPNNTKYNLNTYAFLNMERSDTYVNKRVFKWITNTVFGKFIKNGKCGFTSLIVDNTLYCERDFVEMFGTVSIKVQKYEIFFDKRDLFWCSDIKGICFLNVIEKEGNNDDLEIGYSLYAKFVSVFSYDNDTITFYGERNWVEEKGNDVKKRVVVVNTGIVLMGCIWIGVLWLFGLKV